MAFIRIDKHNSINPLQAERVLAGGYSINNKGEIPLPGGFPLCVFDYSALSSAAASLASLKAITCLVISSMNEP